MRSRTKKLVAALIVCATPTSSIASPLREKALRDAALNAGVVPLVEIQPEVDLALASVGEALFEAEFLSLNSDMSCQRCHLDRFSSGDGLPNAIGTGGEGEGKARLLSDGDIVPRNALPLWGRGTRGFETFFWDAKVRVGPDGVISQFGKSAPSDDPLVVAVHLPFVEIREMVARDDIVAATYEIESVDAAAQIYAELARRVIGSAELGPALAATRLRPIEELRFIDIAEAIAAFIRSKFAVHDTRFNDFMFHDGSLEEEEIRGGLIFYGKGRCGRCHSGPLFSDLELHATPFAQVGFGKNGFGVDYGAYNATRDVRDLYKFRTPPLINVARTGPYTHSGAVAGLSEVIAAHFDPLAYYNGAERTSVQRREDLARLAVWLELETLPEPLDGLEIQALVAFLNTLSVHR